MKITKVSVSRKFNLGNYETLDVGAEAELSESDNPLDVWSVLKDNCEMWFIAEQRKAATPQQPQPEQEKPQATPAAQPGQSAPDILSKFPEELAKRLSAEQKGDYWILRPTHFLGAKTFGDIMKTVRELGGEYVSAGKESHFRIPVKKA